MKPPSPHQFKEKSRRYYNCSNSYFTYKRSDHFHIYSNCDVVKNHIKKDWVKKTDVPTRRDTKKNENLLNPPIMKTQMNEKRHNLCFFCKTNGHWENKCWKLPPEVHHKSSRQLVKEPVKEEAPFTIRKA